MKKTLMTTTLVVSLLTPAALAVAGERTITVPTPKSITLVCSDSVRPGTVVLTNPPKFSCKDYELVQSAVGMGITIGPDTKVEEIKAAFKREQRKIRIAKMRSEGRLRETGPNRYLTSKGIQMTRETFDNVKPIPTPKFSNDGSVSTPRHWNDGSVSYWKPRRDRFEGLTPTQQFELMNRMAVQNRRSYWEAWDERNGTFTLDDSHKWGNGIRRNRTFFND